MELHPKTVVMVDDDKLYRNLFTDILQGMGLTVMPFSEGRSGREWLKEHRPALVCLDLTLPDDVSGYDLCDFIRRSPDLSTVPIVMISSRDQVADRANAEEAGANAYLVKPQFKRIAEFEKTLTQLVRKFIGEEAP
jgi:DNA-binding response OmpR family regulator